MTRAIRDRLAGSGGRALTGRALLARAGRVGLWLAVALVLTRGTAGLFAAEPPAPELHAQRAALVVWPDDAARAFAVEFAWAYLTRAPRDAETNARTLADLASPELAAALAPRRDDRAPRQAVGSATPAGTVRIDRRHALVTVAATVIGDRGVRRALLTVPVGRDEAGGLVVYDLPSFAAAPARAATAAPAREPLLGRDRAPITDVLSRFLRAYLAGDTRELAYLVPPGTRIAAAAGRFELIELTSLAAAGSASGRGRLVLATVHARDAASRSSYALRYRVRVVKHDRWYVAEINGPGNRGEQP